MDRFSKTTATKTKKKNYSRYYGHLYEQDMDTQLKTMIIRNFKWLHPTDPKIPVITF